MFQEYEVKGYMNKFIVSTIAIVFTALLFVGCCPCRKGKNNLSLQGREWHLVRMMNHDLNITAEQFVFTYSPDGTLSGVGACNRIFGKYSLGEKRAMNFRDIASTKMMCRDIALESDFIKILNQTTHYEIDGDMLLLLSNGDMQAVLQAVAK